VGGAAAPLRRVLRQVALEEGAQHAAQPVACAVAPARGRGAVGLMRGGGRVGTGSQTGAWPLARTCPRGAGAGGQAAACWPDAWRLAPAATGSPQPNPLPKTALAAARSCAPLPEKRDPWRLAPPALQSSGAGATRAAPPRPWQ
jgi:hypothetical protein